MFMVCFSSMLLHVWYYYQLASQKFLMDRLNPFKKSYEKGEKRAVENEKDHSKKSNPALTCPHLKGQGSFAA